MMMALHKNGSPDLWIGRKLYEVKRGKDRLSKNQREWAQRYFEATGQNVGVVYFEWESFFGGWNGGVFPTFESFDSYIQTKAPFPPFEFTDDIFQAVLDLEYNRKKVA